MSAHRSKGKPMSHTMFQKAKKQTSIFLNPSLSSSFSSLLVALCTRSSPSFSGKFHPPSLSLSPSLLYIHSSSSPLFSPGSLQLLLSPSLSVSLYLFYSLIVYMWDILNASCFRSLHIFHLPYSRSFCSHFNSHCLICSHLFS